MDQELTGNPDGVGLPEALNLALNDLKHAIERLLPVLSAAQGRRSLYRLERVIAEASDPSADPHWWAVYLDLIVKAAQEHGVEGQPVVDAVQRLIPLLHERLGPYEEVSLQEITEDTVVGICYLSDTLTEPRRGFVAPNAFSLAQAHFNKHAWFRAIYAGKAPVGFLMLEDDDETQEYYLWRFMIAGPYHGRGYGRQAIQRLVEYVRTRPGANELVTSCGEGEGSPKEFYLKQGFVPTGEVEDDETVLRLVLA